MPYISHGYWIGPGEPTKPAPPRAKCGGPGLCPVCGPEAFAIDQSLCVRLPDPDRPCPHEHFAATVEVNRLASTEDGPIHAYSADIRVQCADCGEPFRWIGLQAGLMPTKPMVSVDETELRAPLRPASSDPDFGLGIPGFAIRQVV